MYVARTYVDVFAANKKDRAALHTDRNDIQEILGYKNEVQMTSVICKGRNIYIAQFIIAPRKGLW